MDGKSVGFMYREGSVRASRKPSLVATSNTARAGRSARAQITPWLAPMSPDCRPCVTSGRLPAREMRGIARPTGTIKAPAPASFRIWRRDWIGGVRFIATLLLGSSEGAMLVANHDGQESSWLSFREQALSARRRELFQAPRRAAVRY